MSDKENRRMTLKRKVHRRNAWIAVFAILALLASGHIIWCLVHHVDVEKVQICSVCGQEENFCTCMATIDNLRSENESLRNAQAELEAKLLAIQALVPADDGLCHSACPVHCPSTCLHESVYSIEGDWVWTLVGTSDMCQRGTRLIQQVCADCGKILDSKTEVKEDKIHSFGEDNKCDDCGYTKIVVEPTTRPTARPTAKPTARPTARPTAEPTARPTARPTAEPTARPTARPTTKPTARPTVQPTATPCPHYVTYEVTGDWQWSSVGTESTCRRATRTVKIVCKECGAVISTKEETQVDTDHSFSGRTCTDCGYNRPLREGSGEAEGYVPSPTNSWEYEDGEVGSPVSEVATFAKVADVEVSVETDIYVGEVSEINAVSTTEVISAEAIPRSPAPEAEAVAEGEVPSAN